MCLGDQARSLGATLVKDRRRIAKLFLSIRVRSRMLPRNAVLESTYY